MPLPSSNRVLVTQAALAGLAVALLIGVAAKAVESPVGGDEQAVGSENLSETHSDAHVLHQKSPDSGTLPNVRPDNESGLGAGTGQDATFIGTIAKNGPELVLRVESGKIYSLDSGDIAKPYEGRTVRVTGRIEEKSGALLVSGVVAIAS